MIKEYGITYEKKKPNGQYYETVECQIKIPATCLFDAVNYAHNILELEQIKEVVEV